MSKNSLKAATLAAAKVNAMLYAKGKLKLPDGQKNQTMHGVNDRSLDSLITREYEINDVPAPARNLLTRGFVQDEICKYSGASISTRGRYITFEERLNTSSKDRPLYLHIQGSSKEAVNLAMARIQEMIAQFDKSFKPSPEFTETLHAARLSGTTPSSGGHYVQDKVFVGLESSSSAFSVRERILGPGSSFLQHIKVESGATVTLRGRGSGYIEPTSGQEAFEPMYIHLTHPKPEGLQAAKTLALNLIDTVHAEYALFQQQSVQALMPVNINPHTNISFPGHVPVVSSVPTVLNHNLISTAPQGFLPAVSSVQTVLGPSLAVPVSQGVYTSTNGMQHTFVNTVPVVAAMPPLPNINSVTVPMCSVPPINMTSMPPPSVSLTEQALSLRPVPSVPHDPAPVPLNHAPVPINTVPAGLVAPGVTLNPATSIAMSSISMSSFAMNPVTSVPLYTVAPMSVNSVTTVPVSTIARVPMPYVPPLHSGLLPHGTSASANSLEVGIPMGVPTAQQQPLPLNQGILHMTSPPPLPQPTTGYRGEMVIPVQSVGTPVPVPMPQQPLPPTTYTHLYMKQQQMNVPPLMPGAPPPVQQGHKRKFREEGPDLMPPPHTPVMMHQPPYSLQAGASLVPTPPAGGTPSTFVQPSCSLPPPPQHHPRMATPKRHLAGHGARGIVDGKLMPPPDHMIMPPPPAPSTPGSSIRQETNTVTNRCQNGDGEGKRSKGALSGLAALYNSDDSDEEAGSSSKSN